MRRLRLLPLLAAAAIAPPAIGAAQQREPCPGFDRRPNLAAPTPR